MTVDLVLVGFGNVARRFVDLVHEQRRALARDEGLDVRIIAIATKRHGCAVDHAGLDARALARRVEQGLSLPLPASGASAGRFIRAVAAGSAAAREGRLVLVETTTLDIGRGEPATAHVKTALAAGAHVVTANKGPVAFAYKRLARAAGRAQRRFLFEGAVMDGIPVFNLAREVLPLAQVTGFRGVVNSTTNFILTALEAGQAFDVALREMQAAGIAEADASLDVDGWDAAAKAAALSNVLLGAALTPHQVDRQGIGAATAAWARRAKKSGRRVKLVASARREGRRVEARVAPVELDGDDLLAGLEGQQNALVLETSIVGSVRCV